MDIFLVLIFAKLLQQVYKYKKKDNSNQLVKENQTYLQLKRQTVSEIRVFMDEFEQKAKEMNIFDVNTFYTSQEFKDASYSIDRETKAIWRPITSG